MQNAPEIWLDRRTNQSCPVHHLRNGLKPLTNLEAVDRSINRREGTKNPLILESLGIRLVTLRIKGFWRRHPAGEPN